MKLRWSRANPPAGKRRHKGNRRVADRPRWNVRGRHLMAAVSLALLLAMLGGGLHALRDPARFPIRSVYLEKTGFRHLDVRDVQSRLQTFIGQGFFTVNVDEVRARLQGLPWVDRVSVRRVWPDVLQVMVVEQWPLARWGRNALLNRRGEVFTPASASLPEGLPELEGPPGQQHQVAGMYQGISRLMRPLRLGVARLRLDDRRAWSLWLENGVAMELGRHQPFARVERFARIYPRLLASRGDAFERVDLRYTNGFAVHWKALSEEGSPHAGG